MISKILNFFKKRSSIDITVPYCRQTLTEQITRRKIYYVEKIKRNEDFAYSLVGKYVKWDGSTISNVERYNKVLIEKMYFLERIQLEELDLPHRLN